MQLRKWCAACRVVWTVENGKGGVCPECLGAPAGRQPSAVEAAELRPAGSGASAPPAGRQAPFSAEPTTSPAEGAEPASVALDGAGGETPSAEGAEPAEAELKLFYKAFAAERFSFPLKLNKEKAFAAFGKERLLEMLRQNGAERLLGAEHPCLIVEPELTAGQMMQALSSDFTKDGKIEKPYSALVRTIAASVVDLEGNFDFCAAGKPSALWARLAFDKKVEFILNLPQSDINALSVYSKPFQKVTEAEKKT